jgi:hypothetical protein
MRKFRKKYNKIMVRVRVRKVFVLLLNCFLTVFSDWSGGVGKFGVVRVAFIAVINFLITDKQKAWSE